MTNYAAISFSPVVSSLASKEKGSFGNRVDCAASQVGNELKAAAMSAGIIGSAMVLGKNPKTASALEQGVVKGAKALYTVAKKAGEFVSKTKIGSAVINKLKGSLNTSDIQKLSNSIGKGSKLLTSFVAKNPILAGIGLVALTAVAVNKIFKSGQIDQKYTDKAQMQNVVR